MDFDKLMRDTIERLKKVKQEKGLSYSQIEKMLEEKGYYISDRTLKSVLSETSDNINFRYQDTIAPLTDVLLDAYSDNTNIEDNSALKKIIHDKNQSIEYLLMHIEELKSQYSRTVDHLKEQINMLRSQLSIKDSQIATLTTEIARKDKQFEKVLDVCLMARNNTQASDDTPLQ